MDSAYELLQYEPALKQPLTELQCLLWSPSAALNQAYFEWKYERNPYVSKPIVYLVRHQGRLVGMRGFFGTRWQTGVPGEEFLALYADDLVIAPEHRNRGLISKIMSAAFADFAHGPYPFAINLSAGHLTFLSSLAAGWRSVGLTQPMRRRPWRAFLRHLRDRPFADVDASWSRQRHHPALSFEAAPRCTPMAELVERIGGTRIRHVRDSEYFQWRFQNPLSRYRYLYWSGPALEGYLVLQEVVSEFADSRVLNIVDWEASSVEVHAQLLAAAAALVSKRELRIWSVNLSPELTSLLRQQGFRLEPEPKSAAEQRHALLLRPLVDPEREGAWTYAGRSLLDLRNWDLRLLYSMHG
jgi:GNAT superfamily N-acetyltransferase